MIFFLKKRGKKQNNLFGIFTNKILHLILLLNNKVLYSLPKLYLYWLTNILNNRLIAHREVIQSNPNVGSMNYVFSTKIISCHTFKQNLEIFVRVSK